MILIDNALFVQGEEGVVDAQTWMNLASPAPVMTNLSPPPCPDPVMARDRGSQSVGTG